MEILIVVLPVLVLLYWLYVRVITRRNRALEALSGIDVQIKKRANLIPNLLTIAQKFMTHERELLESVTAARVKFEQDYDAKDADQVAAHLDAANGMQAMMGRLMAVAENYPDLKSDTVMVEAQQAYQEVEANIAAARRFYNSSVTDLNNTVQIFPGSVIAGMVNITAMPLYELDEGTARAPIDAAAFLK
ncbi:MAG: LemA family protein [Alphaproteobacteria bacterium]